MAGLSTSSLEWFQFLGSLLFTVSLLPQFVRTVRLRRAEDMSALFLVIVLAASLLSGVYSLYTRQWYFAASFAANLAVWSVVLYYRLRPSPAPEAYKAGPP